MAERAFAGNVTVRLLPVRHPQTIARRSTGRTEWTTTRMRSATTSSATAEPVSVELRAVGRRRQHRARLQVSSASRPLPPYRRQGRRSGHRRLPVGQAVCHHRRRSIRIERALTFLGQGALLSLTGDTQGRLPGARCRRKSTSKSAACCRTRLQHIAPQMWNFSRPSLDHLEDRLVERFTTRRDYSDHAPGKPTYDSIDIGSICTGQVASPPRPRSCCTCAPSTARASRTPA